MKIRQYCIPLEYPEEWRTALNGIRHSFGHTWENCHAMHLTTGLKTFLYCYEQDTVRIVCPIAEREYGKHKDIVKPFGFSGFVGNGKCPEFHYHWNKFVRQQGYICGYLGLNPAFDFSSLFDTHEVFHYDTVYMMDLTPDIDDIFAKLNRARQRHLRGQNDIMKNLVFDQQELEDFFVRTYHDFLRSNNASEVYLFSEATLRFLISRDNVFLVGIRHEGQLASVLLFAYSDYAGEGLLAASLPEGRRYATDLIWHGILRLKSLQVPTLNLGGGGGSIAEFKRQFGCTELPLKCLKQVYQPEVYDTMCREVRADPADMTGYFPAYRR